MEAIKMNSKSIRFCKVCKEQTSHIRMENREDSPLICEDCRYKAKKEILPNDVSVEEVKDSLSKLAQEKLKTSSISNDEFLRYEKVRKSGRTNMFNVRNVEMLAGLRREKIMEIMKNYSELNEKYVGGEN